MTEVHTFSFITKVLQPLASNKMSDDEEESNLCPLCVEEMDLSDKNFLPCPCGYRVSFGKTLWRLFDNGRFVCGVGITFEKI